MSENSVQRNAAPITPLTGPRWSPNAYPLLAIAKDAVHGHAMIAEKVREHAEAVAAERAAQRAARGAQPDTAPPAATLAP